MSDARALANAIVHRYLTLVRFQRHMGGILRRTMSVSGRQVAALRYLLQMGPCSVGQISAFLYVRDATTSCLLDRMERDGYVTRRRSPEDNRKVLVEPTELGREVAARAPMTTVGLLRERLPQLPVEELLAIDHALRRLSEIAEVDESILE